MKRRDARRVPIIAMSANAFAEDIINSRLAYAKYTDFLSGNIDV
ncbi:hypothetical protein [Blautia sp. HCP28S3_G10]